MTGGFRRRSSGLPSCRLGVLALPCSCFGACSGKQVLSGIENRRRAGFQVGELTRAHFALLHVTRAIGFGLSSDFTNRSPGIAGIWAMM